MKITIGADTPLDTIEELFQKEAEEFKATIVPEFLKACERMVPLEPIVPGTIVTSIPSIAAFSSEYFVAYNHAARTFFRCEAKTVPVDIGHVKTPDLATKLDLVDPDAAPQHPSHYLPTGVFDSAELDGYGVFKIKATFVTTPTQHP